MSPLVPPSVDVIQDTKTVDNPIIVDLGSNSNTGKDQQVPLTRRRNKGSYKKKHY